MCDILNGIMETKYFGMDFTERMDFYKVPGLSLAVVEEGNIQTKCFGVCDKDTRREIDDETLFQAASISKVLFAVSVLRLAEAKIIDLDQDIRQYSDVSFYKTFDAKPHVVTFRNLLGHVSGFNISGFTGYLNTMEIPTIEQILRGQFPANNIGLFMQAKPNTGWMYSGGGYILGQKVICDILNETFEHIIREWVLLPLGISMDSLMRSEMYSFFICCISVSATPLTIALSTSRFQRIRYSLSVCICSAFGLFFPIFLVARYRPFSLKTCSFSLSFFTKVLIRSV